jgi:hypothetical protein
VQGAVGEELKERRRLIASAFGGGASPREAQGTAEPGAPRRERPRTPAGAEKVLSARTIFMPAADLPDSPEEPAEAATPPAPRQKHLIAVIAVAVGLTFVLLLFLAVKSVIGRHAQANRDQAAEAATPIQRAAPVEPPPAGEPAAPARAPQGP